MLNLTEIIESLKAQGATQVVKKPVDLPENWVKCMDYIDSLPSDFENQVLKHKTKAKTSRKGKLSRISVNLGNRFGYETEMIVYQELTGKYKYAWYVAFNDERNTVYKRDLFGGKE